jgi:hypothetical protein
MVPISIMVFGQANRAFPSRYGHFGRHRGARVAGQIGVAVQK